MGKGKQKRKLDELMADRPSDFVNAFAILPVPIVGEFASVKINSHNAEINRRYARSQGLDYSRLKQSVDTIISSVLDRTLVYGFGIGLLQEIAPYIN
jgi:hypothetical protein